MAAIDRATIVSRDRLGEICRRYDVTELRVFGSALSDAFRAESDIDVLVEFAPDARIGFFELARLQRE
ncbi:MAG TPA: nucleotidyltransferase domain-containing protein, partial [Thermomicrobiales bacterium]|nr:nucleotidyltransferase domain-containing protein [Thermomicrobiales bacterium]